MEKKLFFMEWSMNMRSDKTVKPHEAFYHTIKGCIPRPDVLFLVETVKGNNFPIEGYTFVVESDNPVGNTTRIAIRNALLESGEVQVLQTCGRIPNTSFDDAPHFAQADVLVNGQVLNLIAARVLICCGRSTVEEYAQRRRQFDLLVAYLATLENPVVMGDFNHARILGLEHAPADVIRTVYDEYVQVQGDYFYQSIREDLWARNLAIHTPDFLISCGPKVVDGALMTKESPSWNYKIDHLIAKAESNTLQINDVYYDWSHLERAVKRGATKAILKRKGFPDHAMLVAVITLSSPEENEAQ